MLLYHTEIKQVSLSSRCSYESLRICNKSSCMQAGVTAHGSVDHELWLQYAAFEQKHLKGAGSVYWRAVKVLADPDTFVAAYSKRQTQ